MANYTQELIDHEDWKSQSRIRELEAKLAAAKELVYRNLPKPFSIESYTVFYEKWMVDRERIFGDPAAFHANFCKLKYGEDRCTCGLATDTDCETK